jgi:hypothetical protein
VGTSINAAREDHIHALPSGLMTQIAAVTVGETMLISVSLGVKRYAVSVPGTAVTDKIVLALSGAPSNGTLQDAYVSAAGTVSVGVLVPSVGIGAVISVPLIIYKVS